MVSMSATTQVLLLWQLFFAEQFERAPPGRRLRRRDHDRGDGRNQQPHAVRELDPPLLLLEPEHQA
jgi:hypothetical protein